MKITRRDLGVIMILVGFFAAFLVYQLYFTDMQTQVEALQEEQKSLKTQISELQPVVDDAPYYESEMERFQTDISDMMDEFSVDVLYEDGIMYVVELEENLAISIPSFSTTEASVSDTVEGAGSLAGYNYTLASSSLSFSYTLDSYDDMKDFVNYIYDDKENKRTITSISMSFGSTTGEITGSVVINTYAMSDGVKDYEEQDLPLDDLGVENIFGEIEETEEAEEEE